MIAKRYALTFLPGLALVVVVLLALGAFDEPATYHGTHLSPAMAPADFTLESPDGPVALSDFEGKITPMFFGFTSCPDVCPITLQRLASALEGLGKGRDDVQVVFVSVDPERDSPERATSYARAVDPSFVGLSGSQEQITAVASHYGIHHERAEGGNAEGGHAEGGHANGYMVEHTATVLVLNREGGLELLWSPPVTASQMAEDLATLLDG